MATIRTAIQIYDGMSRPLQSMHRAMGILLNSFESMQSASSNAIDTAAIREAREELARAGAAFDEIERNIRETERAQDRFNNRIRDGTSATDGLWSKLKGIAATVGLMAGTKKILDLSDTLSSTTARLNLLVNDGKLDETSEKVKSIEDQNTTIQVNGNNSVANLVDHLSSLEQDKTVSVQISDNGTIGAVEDRLHNIPDQVNTQVTVYDSGSIGSVQDKIQAVEQNRTVAVNASDNGSLEELEQKVMASAQRSRAAYFDTASAVAKLGLNAGAAFGNDMDQVIAFMEQVNKQFVIGGATAQEQSNAMIQLTQAMAAGALRGEELNSILDAAPGIARAIESYMGVAEGSIKQYAEQGLVTAEVVKNALFETAGETNAAFESMPMTWAQIWTSMQNKALSIFAPILRKINDIGNGQSFTQVSDGIINSLAGIASIATVVFDLLVGGSAFVIDNWSWISPIIYGVVGALMAYYGAQMGVNAVTLIGKGIHVGMAAIQMTRLAVTGALTAATAAETAAQHGLNAALYACPLVWIIMLVIALVAIFYAAVAAVNHFAGTSVSATGLICGAFMAALAFIGNIFIFLFNLVIDGFVMIYNLVAMVANFIGNVFNDPVGAVCRLFFDLADTVLSVLQSLASAIDTVFGSDLASSVQGWRDGLGSWVDSTFGKGVEVMEQINGDDIKLGRFEYGAAFNMGNEFGKGVEDTVGGLFDFSAMDSMGAADGLDAFNLGNSLDGIYNNTGDTAGNTAAMNDTLNIAEEDLEYMRDIAEREAINRYTTAQIKVEQHNENHISSDMDLDGIMNVWTNDFAEKLDISGEGVHE